MQNHGYMYVVLLGDARVNRYSGHSPFSGRNRENRCLIAGWRSGPNSEEGEGLMDDEI